MRREKRSAKAWLLEAMLLVCACAAVPAHSQSRGPAQVTRIEHSVGKDSIRVVVRCDAPVQYVGGTATDPFRIFFDLQGTRPAGGLAARTRVGDALVQGIRVGQNRPGVTRMVLDLAQAAPYTASFLDNPPRLVVEVMRGATLTEAHPLPNPSRQPAVSRKLPTVSRKVKVPTPAPVASALLPPAPVVLNPEQMPPTPPHVTYQNGLLTIVADNSTLSDILHAVAARTGASVDAPANLTGQRVAARLGPGPPRDVIADLLSGLDYIVVGAGNDPDAIRSIIVSSGDSSMANPRPVGVPVAEAPPLPPEPDPTPTEPEPPAQPAVQAPTPGEGGKAAAPQVKSPEELLEELRKLQEQQAKEPPH
jgi:hypothetical protein